MKSFLVDQDGYYGEFGGAYVPEILHKCVEELKNTYLGVLESEDFKKEFDQLLRDYVGRPSPLYLARRLSEKYGCKMYLKREDLNHTGAHKINNTIGQILLARRMGKKRIIAETGAGQHGVATATVCALMDMECIVYMGKTDVERQPRKQGTRRPVYMVCLPFLFLHGYSLSPAYFSNSCHIFSLSG